MMETEMKCENLIFLMSFPPVSLYQQSSLFHYTLPTVLTV